MSTNKRNLKMVIDSYSEILYSDESERIPPAISIQINLLSCRRTSVIGIHLNKVQNYAQPNNISFHMSMNIRTQ